MLRLCQNCFLRITIHTNKNMIFKNNILTGHLVPLYSTIENNNLLEWNRIKSKYSAKELKIVFDTLKTSNMMEMKKFGISENSIESLQNKKEMCRSLDDIILHDIVEIPQMVNICAAIVSKRVKRSSIVTPTITKEKLENFKTVVGLRIKPNHISWSHLNITGFNCNILNWDCQSVLDLPINASYIEVIKIGINIAKCIPDSDAYIMEKETSKPMSKINTSTFRLSLRQHQLISTILALLSTRNNTQNTLETSNDQYLNSFYMMKPFAPAHHFGLFLGNESVSANNVVHALLQQQNVGLENVTSISLKDQIVDYYYSSNVYIKEEMNQSLLLALTFVDQVVLENYTSMA